MFGLFKPPRHIIRKRIPEHALLECVAIESFADVRLRDLSERSREYAVAFIISVWAYNSAVAGKFSISTKDHQFIQHTGMNAAKTLSADVQDRGESVVHELIENGMIPKPEHS